MKSGLQPLIASLVALRKESVDRNGLSGVDTVSYQVALRKESVDRNSIALASLRAYTMVALRKESVDRNYIIKITGTAPRVALRKESVDRNGWLRVLEVTRNGRSPQGERG